MTTPRTHLNLLSGLCTALLLGLAGTLLRSTLDVQPGAARDSAVVTTAPPVTAQKPAPAAPAPYSYGWPIKPFYRQHPVRGFFGDPRIANHGTTRQFHFGVDVYAPNGTPVYATLTGRVYIHPLHEHTVVLVGRNGLEFSYWHVVPVVQTGARAVAYRTVIGHVEKPYAHVHFSEARNGRYVNPLRPGALGPFTDGTQPRVASARSELDESGGVDLVARVFDETPLAVPRPWHDLPVTPALVRWRLVASAGRVVLGWRTALDFRETIPPASAFSEVWAPGTTQNHVRSPGRYRVYLARGIAGLTPGRYVLEIVARDIRGNSTRARFLLPPLNRS